MEFKECLINEKNEEYKVGDLVTISKEGIDKLEKQNKNADLSQYTKWIIEMFRGETVTVGAHFIEDSKLQIRPYSGVIKIQDIIGKTTLRKSAK